MGWSPRHRGPHLSGEKALGAGRGPSFSVGPLRENAPHVAFGQRMPVHCPPLSPLQHFLTQPSRALQGTPVHPVQRRDSQIVLHVYLSGYIHTHKGGSASCGDPAPDPGRSRGLNLPSDQRSRLRPPRVSQRLPGQGEPVRADPVHFRVPLPS